jgi:hypothetical protein
MVEVSTCRGNCETQTKRSVEVYKGKNLDPMSQTMTDILARTRHSIPDRPMETSETVSDIEPVGSIFFGLGTRIRTR